MEDIDEVLFLIQIYLDDTCEKEMEEKYHNMRRKRDFNENEIN